MRILKHGVLWSRSKYTLDCPDCGCRYVAKSSEAIRIAPRKQGSVVVGRDVICRCPECGTVTSYEVDGYGKTDTLDRYYDGSL